MEANAEIKLSVEGEPARVAEDPMAEVIDLIDRDPTHLNDHVKVIFNEVIAEPHPSVFSFDSIWQVSFKVFRGTKLWCYRITTLILGVPLALLWGINFACMAFCTIWCCRPCAKAYHINMVCYRDFFQSVIDCFFRPLSEAFGYIFYNIRWQQLPTPSPA